jgi:hypothetical protein
VNPNRCHLARAVDGKERRPHRSRFVFRGFADLWVSDLRCTADG